MRLLWLAAIARQSVRACVCARKWFWFVENLGKKWIGNSTQQNRCSDEKVINVPDVMESICTKPGIAICA